MSSARSGQASKIGAQLLVVLGRHLSSINAQNVLSRALREAHLGSLNGMDDLRRVQPSIERGLRLFLPHTSVSEVLADLARSFAAEPPAPRTIPIRAEDDISEARLTARAMCEQLGARQVVVQKIATVVSELARNIYMYTPGGRLELVPDTRDRTSRLTIRALDEGAGIANLEEIMAGRYRSKTGLGAGLRGTKRLVDRFAIDTGPGGTRIEIGVDL
ncbi:MAG TPA: ATP-binding protein [Kofleriaceae bacterium]|nr:ATP-binding protein [Kofleriaceae bacterium]